MWTHRYPYQPSEPTVESIERHARIALSQSLHNRTLVAFVGSGVSAAYQGPNWSDLVLEMGKELQATFQKLKIDHPELPLQLRFIERQLKSILGENLSDVSSVSDSLSTVLALCESALERVSSFGDEDKRKEVRGKLSKKICQLGSVVEANADIVAALAELHLTRFATLNYDFVLERCLMQGRRPTWLERPAVGSSPVDLKCYSLPRANEDDVDAKASKTKSDTRVWTH